MKQIVARWNQDYFHGELSQACLEELNQIDEGDSERVDIIDTFLFYFHQAGGLPRNMPPFIARFLVKMAKTIMPSLWAKIPPITRSGRLRVIDRLAFELLGLLPDHHVKFLDVGCGYPPMTTVETSEACPGWTCVGIDPNFPASILFDGERAGGCFDGTGTLVFIQYLQGDLQPDLHQVETDKQLFELAWRRLQHDPKLREESVHTKRLVVNPTNNYEGEKLHFLANTLTELKTYSSFDLIRCMNVFMYFNRKTILENIRHAKSLLTDPGWFICGNLPEPGTAARYLVYQKFEDKMKPRWFGMDLAKFSQRDGNGWWAFHKDQPETLFLAKIVHLVADNHELFDRVSAVIDQVENELGYSYRDSDGYLQLKGFIHNSSDNNHLNTKLIKECGEDIVNFLGNLGFNAHINSIGHLLIDLTLSQSQLYEAYFPIL